MLSLLDQVGSTEIADAQHRIDQFQGPLVLPCRTPCRFQPHPPVLSPPLPFPLPVIGSAQARHNPRRPSIRIGFKRLSSGMRTKSIDGPGNGSVGFDERDGPEEGSEVDGGPEDGDAADDVALAKWDLSRPGKRDRDGR